MNNTPYWTLIQEHQQHYETKKKKLWDTALQYYNGNFYGIQNFQERSVFKASYNLIFPICETAVSSLLPPNPQVSATPRGRMNYKEVQEADALLNLVLDRSKFRREASHSITESILTGVGIFKTAMQTVNGRKMPVVRNRSPRNVWWDPTARRPEDIRYWIDCTPISAGEMKKKIEEGLYTPIPGMEPDAFPKWLLEESFESDNRRLRDQFQWFTVYEVYDVVAQRVLHITKDGVLLEDDMAMQPFSLFNLNWNGEDNAGLSELHLILSQQEEVNALLSQWMKVAHLQIPKFFYDAGIVSEDDLTKLMEGTTGSFSPVNLSGDQLKSLGDAFFSIPTAQLTSEQIGLLDRLEKIMSVVSAMAEAARGQVTGAKTATEMAFIDANLRTRLSPRKGNFEQAVEDMASKVMFAASRWMDPFELKVGEADPVIVDPAKFQDIDVQWSMASYSPIKQNSAVYAETVAALLPILRDSPTFRQRDIDLLINDAFDLGLTPIPEEEVAAAQQAAAQQQAAAAGQIPAQQELNPAEESAIPAQVAQQLPSSAEQQLPEA